MSVKESENSSVKSTPEVPHSSRVTSGQYVILMETNGKEYESWYYFIRREGNEEALKKLQEQLESVDWYIVDDLSTFDLDLDHNVSATTAKEMTKVELNSQSFHRKFDGKLRFIDFGFDKMKKKKSSDKMNIEKMCRVFDVLGYGQIDEYISDEDIDPEDLVTDSEDDESNSEEDTEDESDEKESPKEENKKKPSGKKIGAGSVPGAMKKDQLPGWMKAKRR